MNDDEDKKFTFVVLIYDNKGKMNTRKEKDSIGYIDVPADAYWAAQTQRSTENFKIGGQRMPLEIIKAYAILKRLQRELT